jgi:DNA/RNA-binding domain of Phe-tRNA-synthetase-like protein
MKKAFFRFGEKYVSGGATSQETDVPVDGKSKFSVCIGSGSDDEIGECEQYPALGGVPRIQVLFSNGQPGPGVSFGHFQQFNARQGCVSVVFEIVYGFHKIFYENQRYILFFDGLIIFNFCVLILACFYIQSHTMRQIALDAAIHEAAPFYEGLVLTCNVQNSMFEEGLWTELEIEIERFRRLYVVEDINKLPGIFEMRQLYKKLGKDPNRYRPSAEALCRRILKDKNLYRINTLVDLINLVSIRTGLSIGGFDNDKICGDLQLGVGRSGEAFEAIGRGILNIEGLPVYRDEKGGIGTPTSDEERTKIDLNTCKLLMIINSAGGSVGMKNALALSAQLLEMYVRAQDLIVVRF